MSSFVRWLPAAALFGALAAPAMAQVDIRSYGARCDGSDDSGAVQAAINAAPSSGGTVLVSCSAGIGANGIVLANKSNVTVAGSASGAGFKALAPTGQSAGGFGPVLFLIQNCTGCVVRDLVIDSRNVGVDAIGFDRCSNSTLQNVSVSNTAYPANAAIVASANRGNSYIGNTVRFTGKISTDGTRGMWIGNGGSQTEYSATVADNTVSDTGATGIVGHVIGSTFRNNLVTNTSGSGIKIVPTPGQGGQTTLDGNTVRGNGFHGIQISGADSPVIIQRNTIDANSISGIYGSDGAFYGRITGNTITNNKEAAVYLYNGDGLSIDNNTMSGNGHGVLLESISGFTMRNLQITSNTISSQSAHGITMWGRGGTIDTLSITSNSIYNGSLYGLFIEQNSGNLVGISASNNCYANNASGTIYDNRGLIAPVPSSPSCGSATAPAPDTTAPQVSVTSPANGATVSGTVTITAAATDNVGVAGVQFQLNGAAFGPKLTTAPYSVQWDSRTATNGTYQWTAAAQDAAGNTTTATAISLLVANADITPPTVSILTPSNGATLTGTVSVTASASDNAGVAAVQYKLDGSALCAEITTAPYAYSWNTSGLAAGTHTLTATARDAAGNQTASSITVTMNAPPAPAPPATPGQYDIKSYGARCDGSDDSGAVQAAINAVPTSGGTVLVSCSAGIGANGIVLANKSNVIVAGSASGAGFRALAPTSRNAQGFGPVMFLVQNCTSCVVRDLVIDSQNVAVSAIGFDTCSGSTLQNVSVSNTGFPATAAIVGVSNSGNTYAGNTVRFTGKTTSDGARGIWLGNGGSQTEYNPTISGNIISDTGSTGLVANVAGATIRNNQVTNASGTGMQIAPAVGQSGQSTIEGNTIRGNLYHGIQVSNATTPVNIQGNTIDANGISGIYSSGGAFYGRITGNTISNQKEAAIYLYNADGLSIDNNQISANGHGILFEAISGNTMRNVQITSNTISGQSAHGITMWGRGGTIDTLAVTSNSITNGSLWGLFIEQTSGNLVGISASGNCFANNVSGTIYDTRGQIAPVPTSSACGNAGTPSDTTRPNVSVTVPANGATVSGTISVTAAASDNVGVTGVQFQLNGAAFGAKLTAAPYTIQWDTRTVADGTYQWTAVAQDAAGNTSTSTAVSVVVSTADTTAPSVSVTAPTAVSVSGTVAIAATATDNVGVTGVQFQLNGAAFGSKLTAAPYSVQWDTRTVANGTYQWTAVAQDAAGNTRTSAAVAVVVANGDTIAPTVKILTPTAGATLSGTVTVTSSASDNIGVAGVRYSVDGVPVGAELAASPYSYSWSVGTLAAGTHTLTATARDAAGNRTSATITITRKDTTAPTVSISAPAAGAKVSGTVTIAAAVSDNVGVVGVQFQIDGANFGSETTGDFKTAWDTTKAANGTHTIRATARDAAGNKRTSSQISVTVSNTTSAASTAPVAVAVARINVCGGAYTDPSGNVWAADSGFSGGYCDNFNTKTVAGTTAQPLYQTQRWDTRTMTYQIPVASGNYTVNLKFAELYFTAVGQRVFNVAINGQAALTNFDIIAAAGGVNKAIDVAVPTSVTNGVLTIQFNSTVDDPAINAIEVLKR